MTNLIVLLGPTGAGKSTQAAYLLSRHPGWVHISSGDLLRHDPVTAAQLNSGQLANPDEVLRLVDQALQSHRHARMIILDGFPRTLDQVPWLNEALKRYELHLQAVVHLEISKELAAQRLAVRHRNDDGRAAIEAKWQWYHDQTTPLLAHYEGQGLVVSLDGAAPVEDVGRGIEEALHV